MTEKEENPIVELVKTLLSAAVLAIGIRACVAEARYIPSESMLPTLEIRRSPDYRKNQLSFSQARKEEM